MLSTETEWLEDSLDLLALGQGSLEELPTIAGMLERGAKISELHQGLAYELMFQNRGTLSVELAGNYATKACNHFHRAAEKPEFRLRGRMKEARRRHEALIVAMLQWLFNRKCFAFVEHVYQGTLNTSKRLLNSPFSSECIVVCHSFGSRVAFEMSLHDDYLPGDPEQSLQQQKAFRERAIERAWSFLNITKVNTEHLFASFGISWFRELYECLLMLAKLRMPAHHESNQVAFAIESKRHLFEGTDPWATLSLHLARHTADEAKAARILREVYDYASKEEDESQSQFVADGIEIRFDSANAPSSSKSRFRTHVLLTLAGKLSSVEQREERNRCLREAKEAATDIISRRRLAALLLEIDIKEDAGLTRAEDLMALERESCQLKNRRLSEAMLEFEDFGAQLHAFVNQGDWDIAEELIADRLKSCSHSAYSLFYCHYGRAYLSLLRADSFGVRQGLKKARKIACEQEWDTSQAAVDDLATFAAKVFS